MSIEQTLINRSDNKCELCGATTNLAVFEVPPVVDANSDKCVLLCDICKPQVEGEQELTINHWHCLNDSMWSPVAAVQVVAWRMLKRLSAETWAQDALEMLYLEPDILKWAEKGAELELTEPTLDSNGVVLQSGDTIVLIKDLEVKGASFNAKRGTAVRNISLTSNPKEIEGRVNGQRLVISACYVKK